MNNTEAKAALTRLYWAAVNRALPALNTAAYLPQPPAADSSEKFPQGRTIVIGAGKAAGAMAQAVDALWPTDAALSGMVITRYGHTPKTDDAKYPAKSQKPRINIVEAAHPVPDAAGIAATQAILDSVKNLSEHDLVLCLISGGGSSLLCAPTPLLSFTEKQDINRALLHSGANIAEMNCVRKHLSAVKGGRLAAACFPARLVTLLISDVPGDAPDVIASGPTVGDPSTCAQALEILTRYNIVVPQAVLNALQNGELETPKPDDAMFVRNSVYCIATPQQSLDAAAACAKNMGFDVVILGDDIEGESRDIAQMHASLVRSTKNATSNATIQTGKFPPFVKRPNMPLVILSGGETTVTVSQNMDKAKLGKGGRAGEFCLSLAKHLQGMSNVYALAADTDGIDGVEDNAGAFVLPDTLTRAESKGVRAQAYLDRHDSYGYFETLDDLFFTGPTHTNVNDFRAILIA